MAKGKTGPELPYLTENRRYMFGNALGFYIAYKRCIAQIPFSPNVHQGCEMQGVVCAALSVEIYLKTLLVMSEVQPETTHDLKTLFTKLPEGVQATVRKLWDAELTQREIDDFIEEIRGYFVGYRYVYEREGSYTTQVYLFHPLIKALHNTALSIDPELRNMVTGGIHELRNLW